MSRPVLRPAALAIASAAALSGCVSLLPQTPPVQLYRFGQGEVRAANPAASAAPVDVLLARVELPRGAAGDGLLTVRGGEAAYVADARWLAPAEVLLQEATARAFRARSATVRLLDPGETGASSATLRLDGDEFDARYGDGAESPTVVVSLHVSLVAADGRRVVDHAFVARQPAAENRVSSIVAAYDAAVAETLARVVDWTGAEAPRLAAPPSVAGASRP